jgi:hypothetical protein
MYFLANDENKRSRPTVIWQFAYLLLDGARLILMKKLEEMDYSKRDEWYFHL